MLFSDIEGSTSLLSRLGDAYVEALDGQRHILREAWRRWGGVEMGTEGDSFFVVFPTAEGAVSAAAQAQRELAQYPWPAGERVQVRMGIHTGTPTVHEGGYIGMDVHRAARIASAAHGGQVVVSAATAELVRECLPPGAALRDLGGHDMKDIATPEHLLQLVIAGLPADFPPLKTLGASSTLPRPGTPLVGREGELAELTALLSSPGVRLVTLTGPGGTGKTRLAVGLAEQLVKGFPDGVYFVPLASVTTPDVMWTSIAETLDVPPEGRIPPGFFDHVAQRSALLVLDNLEQLSGADDVVAALLSEAPQVVIVATSRRPLSVPGEHVHPVPPLELPQREDLELAETSGAVQLFVQQAKMVRPSFTLTADNAGEVAAICRRLDGLPLAIELAAVRTRLLSPKALVTRLDQALDIAASGNQGPSRQKTLRDTIAWSYDLLNPDEQAFFRRLGVFNGGADLDAVAAVTANILNGNDPLDLVADLVDASLVNIGEGLDGEPRTTLLETLHAYALDQLRMAGELDDVHRLHAQHYLGVAQRLSPLVSGSGDQRLQTRREFEVELDNMREVLSWALEPAPQERNLPLDRAQVGAALCAELVRLWIEGGYLIEGRRWLERAVGAAGEVDSTELGRCLSGLANHCELQGDFDTSREVATRSVAMWRRLGDKERLAQALGVLGWSHEAIGSLDPARAAFEEAISLARELSDASSVLASVLLALAIVEYDEGNFTRNLELLQEVVEILREQGDEQPLLAARHNITCTLRAMGRLEEAHRQMLEIVPHLSRLADPEMLAVVGEDYAALLAQLGHHESAIKLLGAVDAARERHTTLRGPSQDADIQKAFIRSRDAVSPDEWDRVYLLGRNLRIEDVLTELQTQGSSG